MKKNLKKSKKEIPSHIVLLPDGNRRWAEKKGLASIEGHLEGFKNLKRFCDWCQKREVKVLTAFGFSSENWKRPKQEISYLLRLLEEGLSGEMRKYNQKKASASLYNDRVKVRIIGQRERLPLRLQKVIERIENLTKNNKGFILNLAISYSGRWDILQAVQNIIKKKIPTGKITEALLNSHLSTFNLPAPDLIIRTGKEKRLSNFLLWQAAYSELYFSDKYWPDFSKKDFSKALGEYSRRQRRFGR